MIFVAKSFWMRRMPSLSSLSVVFTWYWPNCHAICPAVTLQWRNMSVIALHQQFDSLRWRHNELDGVSDHQPHDCLLNRLFGRRSKKASKLRVTGLCARNSPGTGEFPAQMASNAENVFIWWRHHVFQQILKLTTMKTQSSALLTFCKRILWWMVDSPHKWPVMLKAFPCHDDFMVTDWCINQGT